MDHIELAKQLRANSSEHWNCCQMVVGAFAEEAGITVDQAYALAANFGGGMRMGATCGAITGGLMALGLLHAGLSPARPHRPRRAQLRGAAQAGKGAEKGAVQQAGPLRRADL